ncbi:hypothetical protein BHE74_00011282 [Ensete ventricosum]|nr:hypothetical protein BHE74_00011282 [Ensete ventricosum]
MCVGIGRWGDGFRYLGVARPYEGVIKPSLWPPDEGWVAKVGPQLMCAPCQSRPAPSPVRLVTDTCRRRRRRRRPPRRGPSRSLPRHVPPASHVICVAGFGAHIYLERRQTAGPVCRVTTTLQVDSGVGPNGAVAWLSKNVRASKAGHVICLAG